MHLSHFTYAIYGDFYYIFCDVLRILCIWNSMRCGFGWDFWFCGWVFTRWIWRVMKRVLRKWLGFWVWDFVSVDRSYEDEIEIEDENENVNVDEIGSVTGTEMEPCWSGDWIATCWLGGWIWEDLGFENVVGLHLGVVSSGYNIGLDSILKFE